jgi:AraC-like DNA-binding protein
MAYSVINIISAITIFSLIALASLLLTSNKSTTTARILAVFLLLHALMIAGEMINHSEFVLGRPGLAFWTITVPLLYGPLLWLYTNGVLLRDFTYSKKLSWHFLPFITSLVLLVVFYHLEPYGEQRSILLTTRQLGRQSDTVRVLSLVNFTHVAIYLVFCFRLIRYYRHELYHQYSSLETIHVNWLVSMLVTYFILILTVIINSLFSLSDLPYLYELTVLGLIFSVVIYFTSIFYRVLTFPNFFRGINSTSIIVPISMENKMVEETMAFIDKEVFDKALYTKAYFTLQDLSEATGIEPTEIIYVLNEQKDMSFHEYINRTRIELARRLLSDQGLHHVSELEIMYDTGFSTLSSFRRMFKKYTRKLPGEMREQSKAMPSKSA